MITIDGPAGSGKGTISRLLANRLGYTYLDTGALYRAVALKLSDQHLEEDAPDERIGNILKHTSVQVSGGQVLLDGRQVGEEIRTPEIGHLSSVFSARRVVREFLLGVQREAARAQDLVAEGRDMATVVFPDAFRKFFLTASQPVRVNRRFLQLRDKGMDVTMEEAERDIRERDLRDSGRAIAPLRKAEDAVTIDTTALTIEETLDALMRML